MSNRDLASDGAAHFPGAADALLNDLTRLADDLPAEQAGVRLHGRPDLAKLLGVDRAIGALARSLLGDECRPVRAILFDKTEDLNWSLGWHQDRTICVRQKVKHPGFGPWTVKQGLHHVAPPFALLKRMITLRLHLDDVPAENAPLLVALGSHQLGMVAEADIDAVVARSTVHTCLASAGDVWAYSTPILHASQAATACEHRRVFQIDFSADELPGELEWLGID